VDSAQRCDLSNPVVPTESIGWLPDHAVIVDLSVDPYMLDAIPPLVRGVEGIPQGNLDQYVFQPDDPNWDETGLASVDSKNRRTIATFYSWLGIHPEACMLHYAQQLEPFMEVLYEKGYEGLPLDGEYFERALYRASLKYFLAEEKLQV
jgi:alanine dehydrogenase